MCRILIRESLELKLVEGQNRRHYWTEGAV